METPDWMLERPAPEDPEERRREWEEWLQLGLPLPPIGPPNRRPRTPPPDEALCALVRLFGPRWREQEGIVTSGPEEFPHLEPGWMVCRACKVQLAGYVHVRTHLVGNRHARKIRAMAWQAEVDRVFRTEQPLAAGQPCRTAPGNRGAADAPQPWNAGQSTT